ncbi:hypothetical protein BMT55_16150 [Listeria newyorkensis]|uniref:Phage tail protein n=2 Tax=Listeria TaxID=1637 RepID=A0ABX4XIZ5_9LIST|nr:major tail protein [Listeria newyorkensis]PNP87455.1 hypothetical protein BMT55_16150 [Listeria newyorkensis]
MATTEKVAKIGLSEFKYAKLNEEETVESMDDIKNIPGLQEAKQTVVMDSEIIFADDGPYLILNSGITELKLEVGIVDIPTEHKPDLLGVLIEQGMEIYKKDLTPPYVAVSFRFKLSNNKYGYFGMMKGQFSLPSADMKTQGEKNEAQTDSIEGNFVARNDIMYIIGREDHPDFKLEEFMNKVYGGVSASTP